MITRMNDRYLPFRFTIGALALVLSTAILIAGCQTLRGVSNLRKVDFTLDRVSEARLAGVDLREVRSYEDIGATDMLRLSAAIAENEMPLSFTVHIGARNPETNDQDARLTQMDWRLFINETETIAGRFDREVVIPPGQPTDIPIDMDLDLVRFFDGNLREIVNLALALGGDGEPANIQLRARPTVQTAIGPITYPREITIVNEDVSRSAMPESR